MGFFSRKKNKTKQNTDGIEGFIRNESYIAVKQFGNDVKQYRKSLSPSDRAVFDNAVDEIVGICSSVDFAGPVSCEIPKKVEEAAESLKKQLGEASMSYAYVAILEKCPFGPNYFQKQIAGDDEGWWAERLPSYKPFWEMGRY